jgi:hypothetical protein
MVARRRWPRGLQRGYGAGVARKTDSGGRGSVLKTLSRALLAVGAAAVVALIVRVRGKGGTPPHRGGWREVTVTDLGPVDKP